MAGSQALSLLAMAASYHPHTPRELCYSLAVLLHYAVLVALTWLAAYPVMATLKVFRRTWFEHFWLLIPVAGTCWSKSVEICGTFTFDLILVTSFAIWYIEIDVNTLPLTYTVLPAVVVGAIGATRYEGFTDNPDL